MQNLGVFAGGKNSTILHFDIYNLNLLLCKTASSAT
jgi:hypothetical protein